MTPSRLKLLRRQIAEMLRSAEPYLYPETDLFRDLNTLKKPETTLAEFEQVIQRMETDRHILRHRTEEGIKSKLTEEGHAELFR